MRETLKFLTFLKISVIIYIEKMRKELIEMLKIETRAPLMREEIEEEFNRQIEAKRKHMRSWGTCDFWVDQLKRSCDRKLKAFDEGEIIEVCASDYIENGDSYSDVLMSDGSVKTICFGYAD